MKVRDCRLQPGYSRCQNLRVLEHCGRLVVRVMARFIFHRLCRLWDCVSRGFFFFVHRVIFTHFRALVGYVRFALDGGSRDENEDAPSTETGEGLQGVDTEPRPRGWSPEQGAAWGTSSGKERPTRGAREERSGENSAWMTEEEEEEEAVDETADEFYCSYDSTWETEEGGREKAASRPLTSFSSVSEPSRSRTMPVALGWPVSVRERERERG